MLAKKIKYIYLEETSSTNTSDRGGHLWPGHQILREKSSLKRKNVVSSRSGSNRLCIIIKQMLCLPDKVISTH